MTLPERSTTLKIIEDKDVSQTLRLSLIYDTLLVVVRQNNPALSIEAAKEQCLEILIKMLKEQIAEYRL